ncbi:lipoprotein, partial [Williamsoniiplasma somnilux]
MKRLLSLLATLGLTAIAGATVVACGDKDVKEVDSAAVQTQVNAALKNPVADEATAIKIVT